MKEYTLLAVVSVIAVIFMDNIMKVSVLKKPVFYIFLAVITG